MMNDDVFMFKHSATSGILDDQVLKQRNTYFVLLQLLVYNLLFYFRLLVLFSICLLQPDEYHVSQELVFLTVLYVSSCR